VVALAPETVLVGGSGGRAAILGASPETTATTDEVMSYVESLVRHDRIEFGEKRQGKRGGVTFSSHAVETVRGAKVLVRTRFACPGGGPRKGA
jgi:hypothetical protein